VATGQREHRQIFPQAGWVEHDANEIRDNTLAVLGDALAAAGATASDVAAIGITNQRETAVIWDRGTGEPIANAIVWQDTRTQDLVDKLAAEGGVDRFRAQTGLPLATYFSATKIAWLLDSVPGARQRAESGELAFGTTDSWVLWNLTGGVHATDVTNASRTLLMDLATLAWDDDLLAAFGIPRALLPEIRSSSEVYGTAVAPLAGVPIAGILGDQQAATFGQVAFGPGESKNTYGTGNFLIANTGTDIVQSANGLITTVAYRLGDDEPRYALEGSIAVTGSLIQWLRDNLGLFAQSADVEQLALSVPDTGGVAFVPAFSGLFAPYWRPDARGAILGLTRFATKAHIARAALEAVALQTVDVLDAAGADLPAPITELRVDGGMVANDLLMQFQADVLGIPVVRPAVIETTALGAAYAAGLAVGFWADLDELRANWREERRFEPTMDAVERAERMRIWRKAITRTFDWVE
jgi:glycerol kinase